jgi:hypothetical protein
LAAPIHPILTDIRGDRVTPVPSLSVSAPRELDRMPGPSRVRRWQKIAPRLLLIVLLPLLASCGGGDDAVSPTATPPAAATVPVSTTAVATAPPSGAPINGSPAAGSPTAGGATFGDLADRVNGAWAGVKNYQLIRVYGTDTGAAPAGASPAAAAVASPSAGAFTVAGATAQITEQGIVPNQRHQLTEARGQASSESVALDGTVWVRGALAGFVRPNIDPTTWVAVDPAAIDPNSQLRAVFNALAAPITPPFPTQDASLRSRDLLSLGPVSIDGRSCDSYRFVQTTETGGRIDVAVAVGSDNLICAIETRAGGLVTLTRYTAYNQIMTIRPPANALPMATPPAAGTPGA